MILANESPRFLAIKTPDKALIVLSKLRELPFDHPYVRNEMQGILVGLKEERSLVSSTSWLTLIKEAFTVKSYFPRTFLCIKLMMWSNLTGTKAMTDYSPTIFKTAGLSGSSVSQFATGIYGLSLEDLNELFAQNDIRARFTPSRLTIIEADQD
ncbi:hypothetical protein PENSUB_1751 [Penicillium subrubescens]|uniref:Uncharacterized protein n=1 Tax=Penicillium subrubescens TaxID=1316194 RepID=A0A1Q5UJI5_9EURO|nr:hypothetical protein PENSUB_1751 [Penicillium subrubescens]